VTNATVAYGVGLGRSSTSWNRDEVTFQMDPVSGPYLFWGGRNCPNIDPMSICPRYCAILFGPMGRVSSWVHYERVLGLEVDPSTPW
jgi:hypothetical protein